MTQDQKKVNYTWDEMDRAAMVLVDRIKADKQNITDIIAIARGGLLLAKLLAYGLNINRMHLIRSSRYFADELKDEAHELVIPPIEAQGKMLICDDIIDDGTTMVKVTETLRNQTHHPYLVCTFGYKLSDNKSPLILPDYSVKQWKYSEWVVFPWERFEFEAKGQPVDI